MTRILIGLDDTDRPGAKNSTARLARMLGESFAPRATFVGSIGHLLFSGVKATTNNKASCVILDNINDLPLDLVLIETVDFVRKYAEPGSAPGVVLAKTAPQDVVAFGKRASVEEVARAEALACMGDLPHHVFGEGNGVIGALAAIGLTENGWSGRWLEYKQLRASDRAVQVGALIEMGIFVVSLETDAEVPARQDWVDTHKWLRPQLLAGKAALPVRRVGPGMWEAASVKHAEKYR